MSNPWDETLQRRYGDKLAPEKPLPTAAGDDKADVEARVRATEQQRQQDIRTACEISGKPERASAFINSGQMCERRAGYPRPRCSTEVEGLRAVSCDPSWSHGTGCGLDQANAGGSVIARTLREAIVLVSA